MESAIPAGDGGLGVVLKKAMRRDIESRFVPALQAKLDLVYRIHRGRTVDEVASVLAAVAPGRGPEAESWAGCAEAIAAGRRPKVELTLPSGW